MSRPLPKSPQVCTLTRTDVFILKDALSVRTNLGKHSLFVWLNVPSIETGTGRIIRLDELSSVVDKSYIVDKSYKMLLL